MARAAAPSDDEREQEEGDAAEKRGARAGAELVRSGALDQEADACARRREADQQRQVRVRVDHDRHRRAADRGARLPVEVEPPDRRDGGEAEHGGSRGCEVPVRARSRDGDRDDRFAHHDQCEQRPPLRKVARARRDPAVQPRRERWQAQLDQLSDDPDDVTPRCRKREGDEPEGGAAGVTDAVEADQDARFGHRDPGAPVQQQHDRPQDDVRDGERSTVAAVCDVPDQHRHRRDREHRAEVREPEAEIVRVESRRVRHVALPRDPDRDEQRGEAQEATGGVIRDEVLRQLGDRDHEHQVEEQLEPTRVTFALVGQSSQARRLEPVDLRVGLAELDPHPWHSPPRVVPPRGVR